MDRIYIINYLIKKNNAKKYLEIGICDGSNFENVKIDYKIGVDPDSPCQNIIRKSSDDFFKDNTEKFDVIFIDGLHHSDQVYRDIINSLDCLNPSGLIICHDMLPTSEHMQEIPFRGGAWTGDCWKAFVKIKQVL
jgi:predicted O-methyltransferase YrrM